MCKIFIVIGRNMKMKIPSSEVCPFVYYGCVLLIYCCKTSFHLSYLIFPAWQQFDRYV